MRYFDREKQKTIHGQKSRTIATMLLAGSLFFCFSTTVTYADSVALKVSPAIMTIRATPPADVRTPFVIENQGTKPVTLNVVVKRFKQTGYQNGQVQFLTDPEIKGGPDPEFTNKIEIVDDSFSTDSFNLGPKQKKALTLRITLPKDQTISDYYFSVLFVSTSAVDEETHGEVNITKIEQGVGFNVLLSTGSNETPKAYINTFKTPWYKESGPAIFDLEVSNDGSQYISPKGVILIKNMFGQTVGKIDIPKTNILAGSTRSLSNYLTSSKIKTNDKIDVPKAIWPESFLLGFYHAELTLAASEAGPVYTKSTNFVAIPSKLFLGIVTFIVIVIFIMLRLRKKLQNS